MNDELIQDYIDMLSEAIFDKDWDKISSINIAIQGLPSNDENEFLLEPIRDASIYLNKALEDKDLKLALHAIIELEELQDRIEESVFENG